MKSPSLALLLAAAVPLNAQVISAPAAVGAPDYKKDLDMMPQVAQWRTVGNSDPMAFSLQGLQAGLAQVNDALSRARTAQNQMPNDPLFAANLILAVPGPTAAVANPSQAQLLQILSDRRISWQGRLDGYRAERAKVEKLIASNGGVDEFGLSRDYERAMKEMAALHPDAPAAASRLDAQRDLAELDAVSARINAATGANLALLSGLSLSDLRIAVPAYGAALRALVIGESIGTPVADLLAKRGISAPTGAQPTPAVSSGQKIKIDMLHANELALRTSVAVANWAVDQEIVDSIKTAKAPTGALIVAQQGLGDLAGMASAILSDADADVSFIQAGASAGPGAGQALIDRKSALLTSRIVPTLTQAQKMFAALIAYQQASIAEVSGDGSPYSDLFASELALSAASAAADKAAAAAAAAAPSAPAAPATLADAVLSHLKGTKDYASLSALYDDNNAKDANWANTDAGKAVAAQLSGLRADAAAAAVVKTADGRQLQYSVGGQKVTDAGISVADLDANQSYRDTIAQVIAESIAANPLSAQAKAALAAMSGQGASGTPVAPPLKPAETVAAAQLPPPISPAIVVKAPSSALPPATYAELLAAAPGGGLFGWLSGKGNVARYYSKVDEAAAADAHDRAVKRLAIESAAEAAIEAEKTRSSEAEEAARTKAAADAEAAKSAAVAARKEIAGAPSNPDDSARVAAAKRKAELAAFDAKTEADAAAAKRKAEADALAARKKADDDAAAAERKAAADALAAKVDSADVDADLKVKRDALDATVDAAYSDGVSQAVARLEDLYAKEKTAQRLYAERKSGYAGKFYVPERAEVYFTENWSGGKASAAIERCKAALGFKKDGKDGSFKDPSVENVDKICGVRDGVVAKLSSYRGTNDTLPDPSK